MKQETTEKKIVALCTSRIYDSQMHGYIKKLNERLVQENCALLVFAINSDQYWKEDDLSAETTIYDIIPYNCVDVVIIMDEKIKSRTISEKIIFNAKQHNKPVIVVDGDYEGVTKICFDYNKGFENVVRHVMEQRKHKKPHIMAGIPGNSFSDARIEIFKKVVEEYGFKFDDSMVSYGQFWADPAREEMKKLIDSGNVPDALICANDIMAINVFDVLKTNGYRIPDDVMVSGFDGYDEVLIVEPKITTVECSTPGLSDATADVVKRIISGEKSEEIEDIDVIPKLQPNESTGCPVKAGVVTDLLSRFNNSFYRHQDDIRTMQKVTTGMVNANSTEQMVSLLKKLVVNEEKLIKNLFFVLNENCIDTDNYFFDNYTTNINLQEYSLVYDSDKAPTLVKRDVKDTFLRRDNERFMQRITSGYPLIFNSLDYMDIPIGYICYNYSDYDIIRYSRTSNITNTISMGIGGYINSSYQKRLMEKIDMMYKKDILTGLLNRIGFMNMYDKIRSDRGNYGLKVSVIMSDMDGLKYINDHYGHVEGDNAIIEVANALKKACPDDSLCVRYGGDEIFSMILGDYDIAGILRKIDELLFEYNSSSNKKYKVVTSVGYTTSEMGDDYDIKKALRLADKNMYEMKKQHHNNPWFNDKSIERLPI